jgi:hypothetical protein
MNPVTDPELLKLLNADSRSGVSDPDLKPFARKGGEKEVTDSALLAFLNAGSNPVAVTPPGQIPIDPNLRAPPAVKGPASMDNSHLAGGMANALGIQDALWSLGSGALGRFAGLQAAGVGAILPGESGQAKRWLDATQNALTWKPKTQLGGNIVGAIGSGAQWVKDSPVGQAIGQGVDAVGEASPVAGAALRAAPDLLGVLGARAPLNAMTRTAGESVAAGMESTAQSLMNSALKPILKKHISGDAQVAVDTALKYGINPTKGGVTKLTGMLDDVNQQISDAIGSSTATISRDAAAGRVVPVSAKFANQVAPEADLGAIARVADEFGQRPSLLPVQDAQAIKRGTYQVLRNKYGEIGAASTEAQKAIARGLKEEIAAAVPEVSALNQLDSQLIKTLSVVERRTLMDLNKNPMGLSLLSHSPVGLAAYMADKSGVFKAIVARMLHNTSEAIKAKEVAPTVPLNTLGAPVSSGMSVRNLDMSPDEMAGLFNSVNDGPVAASSFKGGPQIPMQAGLMGFDNTGSALRPLANNASAESAASMESIGRMLREAKSGQTRIMTNQDGSNITPLIGPTAVDQRPQAGQIIWQKGIGKNDWTVLDQGEKVTKNMIARSLSEIRKRLEE